ncbi:hypothetical protein Poli38472_011392 [Pythium oligandrum]|uniref:ubiquitinyl hydrolase 1 n=1 Tax=Pythium oligandrum TaxID=41045 RepID=A0A8K1CLI7_PYTOL|nr:hypothetical protein Poli38472_011392 [Pythium oligandrum]|eukprot:TMW64512.1 hypothetical protein Poli38472_011392 [Pythium oligandrum]
MPMLSTETTHALRRLLWARHQPQQDIDRWYQQGFVFQSPTSRFPLGLVQGHGGPCGVLAAVQAEVVRLYLFPERETLTTDARMTKLTKEMSEDAQYEWLARALVSLLYQCASTRADGVRDIRIVMNEDSTASDTKACNEQVYVEEVVSVSSDSDRGLIDCIKSQKAGWQSADGVVLFMFSVLRSRGIDAIRSDMDDQDGNLTGQFGHCSQELVNLLLTGVASSNVFDGAVPMGDTGLMLRGVEARPRLGYLTELEALRYCQVGYFYKCPMAPVWVIGSTSHFSVCFGLDDKLSEVSASQMLMQRIQRVFKSFDPMEGGFLDIGSLVDSLKQLGVSNEILSNEYWMGQLFSRLEVSGAGIVLWDDYWKIVSVLLHTGDLELALSGNFSAMSSGSRPKSDEEIARALQAQFDAEFGAGSATQTTEDISAPDEEEFDVCYYNGLAKRPDSTRQNIPGDPQLARAHIKCSRTEEFIGQSIPTELSSVGSSQGSTTFDDILKTKWPQAHIRWEGESVPSVN